MGSVLTVVGTIKGSELPSTSSHEDKSLSFSCVLCFHGVCSTRIAFWHIGGGGDVYMLDCTIYIFVLEARLEC